MVFDMPGSFRSSKIDLINHEVHKDHEDLNYGTTQLDKYLCALRVLCGELKPHRREAAIDVVSRAGNETAGGPRDQEQRGADQLIWTAEAGHRRLLHDA